MTLSDAIERVKKLTGRKRINTEDDMMHALELFLEEHEEDDIFFSMHKFEFCEDKKKERVTEGFNAPGTLFYFIKEGIGSLGNLS